jgi:hypothetical protein
MIIDKLTEFCDGVALNTGGAATYLIGSQIDLTNVRDIGNGRPIYLVAMVSTAATSGGSATLQLKLASDATAAVHVSTSTEHLASPVFPVASLTAGKVLMVVPLPMEGNVYEQFLGILQVTGTAAFTAGAVDVFLTMNPAAWKAYAEGNN